MRLLLEGDRVLAARWIAWATAQFQALKRVTGIPKARDYMLTRRYPLTGAGDILVKVTASSNPLLDAIEITAAKKQEWLFTCGKLWIYGGSGAQSCWVTEGRSLTTNKRIWRSFGASDGKLFGNFAVDLDADRSGLFVGGMRHPAGPTMKRRYRVEGRSHYGHPLWTAEDTINEHSVLNSLAVGEDGVYFCGGRTPLLADGYDFLVMKLSKDDGATIWEKSFAEAAAQDAVGASIVVRGGLVYCTGMRYDYTALYYECRDAEDGALRWSKTQSLDPWGAAYDAVDSRNTLDVDAGGVYSASVVYYAAGGYGLRIEKRNIENGNVLWATEYATAVYPFGIIQGMRMDAEFLYLAGVKMVGGINHILVKKISKDDGTLSDEIVIPPLTDDPTLTPWAGAYAIDVLKGMGYAAVENAEIVPCDCPSRSGDTFHLRDSIVCFTTTDMQIARETLVDIPPVDQLPFAIPPGRIYEDIFLSVYGIKSFSI